MSEKREKPKAVWGQSQAAYLAGLRNEQVTIVFADGKATKGTLVGVGPFCLFIQQESLEVMVFKSSIKYVHGPKP